MAVLFDNSGIDSVLAPGFLAAGGFPGSQLRMNCEDTHGGGFREFDAEEVGEDDSTEYPRPLAAKKRRLTGEQVRFLEKSFALENKLEPERKIQLASDLGLKPRQVAIWFQNRRARWKTKQMEKEYESLKSTFDSLKLDFESLLKEKEELQSEVAFLTRKLLQNEKNSKNSSVKLQNRDDSADEATICKLQEDVSANSSIMLDSEIPHFIDGGGFSELAEPASPVNLLEKPGIDAEIEKVFGAGFGHRSELHSCSHEFQAEDQAFWFWS